MSKETSSLTSLRVLDLADEKGMLCGKIFSDLGADVIKVEKPGGDPARMIGPFYHDEPGPEKSLSWWAYNTGKRSLTLDIEKSPGREMFLKLVKNSDIVIESFNPGYMKKLGLDYPRLRKINSRLIYISITGFGQTGPYQDYKAPDIVVMALSGVMNLTGSPGRPPLRIGAPQAYLHAGAEAAVAGFIALRYREETGRGQHIDVSAQECVTWEGFNNQSFWDMNRINLERLGARRQLGATHSRFLYECKDGFVYFYVLGGIGAKSQRYLVEWMDREGYADDFLRSFDWDSFEPNNATTEEMDKLAPYFARFFMTKTKQELLEKALQYRVLVAPVNTVKDLLESPQLKSRRFWAEVEHQEPGIKLLYPGFPYISRETPYKISRRAPLMVEHNSEIDVDKTAAGTPGKSRGKLTAALEGLKVADFSWVVTGPVAARYLADHGATVIRIESTKTAPDIARLTPPFKGGIIHPDRSGYFANYNANKYGITLDLGNSRGREIALKLVKWADVLVESFSPGTMVRLGLDYDAVRKINPALVYASTTQMGQTGPWTSFRGYGGQGAALAGFSEIVGYPRGEPIGPFGAYTDFVAPKYLLIGILNAIRHRRRTGRGQYIDQSQIEAGIHFLAPAVLDYGVNNRILSRPGNREPDAAPHNAYRCLGEDRWCAIAVYTDSEWQSFGRAVGSPAWAEDPNFATLAGRKKNEEELDRLVERWTVNHSPEEVMVMLQKAGVAAGVVARAVDLHDDPQFKHRGHFRVLNHPVIGPYTCDTPGFRLSVTAARPGMPAPCLGEHNYFVCTQVLGMSDAEFIAGDEAGAFD